ncbi:MAG: RNA polymerase sigma factor [Thermoleophilaceae bacterium]
MSRAADLEQLARSASAGDRVALEELLGELRPLVVRAARLIVGAGSWAAEDAAQEAMIDIMIAIEKLRDPRAVRAWALRIASRRALRTVRWERLRRVMGREAEVPDHELEEVEGRQAALMGAIRALPPGQRAVLVLRLHSGLSEAQTAEVLGCSVGTVKSQLHDARRRLAAGLRAEGLPARSADRTGKEAVLDDA